MYLESRRAAQGVELHLTGPWRVAHLDALQRELAGVDLAGVARVVIDTSGITTLDLSASVKLRDFVARATASGAAVEFSAGAPDQLRLIDTVTADPDTAAAPAIPGPHHIDEPVEALGRRVVGGWGDLANGLDFIGRIAVTAFGILRSPRRLRPISVARHVYETGITAIPIVTLIAFLISVIIAYMSAQQLQRFGAELFVVDLVTIGVLRELGVLLTAIIVAGRSGSAFAAEIGSMRLNEEVDALQAIGVDPYEALILPRIIALTIALPLLTVIADAVGLTGGALLCKYLLDIPLPQYLIRMNEAIAPSTFWGGPDQGAGVRGAHRIGRHLSGHAGARLVTGAGPVDHRGRRAGDLLRAARGRAVRHAVHGAGYLMQPRVEVQGLVNRFGTQIVHDGLDMRVEPDEIFGIVGGSGAGKSVLLRSILGLQRPNAGTVRLNGADVTRMTARQMRAVKADYGVTFQEGALFSALTVLQNVQLPMLEYLRLPESDLDELAMLKVRMVGLPADAAGKYPSQLSGGMIKRGRPGTGTGPGSAAAVPG